MEGKGEKTRKDEDKGRVTRLISLKTQRQM